MPPERCGRPATAGPSRHTTTPATAAQADDGDAGATPAASAAASPADGSDDAATAPADAAAAPGPRRAHRAAAQPTVPDAGAAAATPDGAPTVWSRVAPNWLLLAAIALLALNLRPAVTSLGAVLGEVSSDLSMSGAVAGLLTTLPVLCFSVFALVTPTLSRRFGSHHVIAVSLLAVVAGSVVRAVTGSVPVFVVATTVALAGMATGNVILPAFIKAHFPNHIGSLTAAYTTTMALGTALPAAVTVPIAQAIGGWRFGIGAWAATAAIALLPWLALARADHGSAVRGRRRPRYTTAQMGRSTIAWALAVYFGMQSLQAYAAFGWLAQIFRDHGIDATQAGLLLSLVPFVGIPISLLLPSLATRFRDQRGLVIACVVAYVVGYGGLLIAPAGGALVWALLLGLGGGAFPLALTMIALRTRDHEVTARLSGFVQSVGYILAAIGPLAVGALFEATGGWTAPIWLLLLLVLPQLVAGLIAGRNRFVDDELGATG